MAKTKVVKIVLPEETSPAIVDALVEEVMDWLSDMRIAGVPFVSEEECKDVEDEQP